MWQEHKQLHIYRSGLVFNITIMHPTSRPCTYKETDLAGEEMEDVEVGKLRVKCSWMCALQSSIHVHAQHQQARAHSKQAVTITMYWEYQHCNMHGTNTSNWHLLIRPCIHPSQLCAQHPGRALTRRRTWRGRWWRRRRGGSYRSSAIECVPCNPTSI